jgi:hypothetical protein
MVLYKSRHKDQWNGIKDMEMNPWCYAHLIFEKSTKKCKLEERQPLQQIWLGKLDIGL